jgi:hypothetical protein
MSKVYENEQSRDQANRGREIGGNSAGQKVNVEKNQSPRGIRIAQGGSGGADGLTTGTNKTYGHQRECGGNKPAEKTVEKHSNPQGREFVDALAGRGGAKHSLIPTEKQVDDRGADASGNSSAGGREKSGQKKAERVSGGVDRWR